MLKSILFAGLAVTTGHAAFAKYPYLQNLTSGSIVVRWEVPSALPGLVQYGYTTGYGTDVPSPSGTMHEVMLSGLTADTSYHYRAISGADTSPDAVFHTPVQPGRPFRFLAYGDNRTDSAAHQSVVNRMLTVANPVPGLMVNVGDLTYLGSQAGYDSFFRIERNLIDHAPLFPALGNHDVSNLANWNRFFALPNNERWYSVRYGNSAFHCLDNYSNDTNPGPQYTWLLNELTADSADPSIRHVFVFFHEPPYTTSTGHSPVLRLQRHLAPLFERFRVDIVFNGHVHCYERSLVNGVHYVVTGGGGAPLHLNWNPAQPYTIYREATYEFTQVDVRGDTVICKSIRPNGTVFDSFNIVHDVAVTRITAPRDTIDSLTPVAPGCSLRNSGTLSETFTIRMKVGAFYDQTAVVTSLQPDSTTHVTFPAYSNWPRGPLTVTCSTELWKDARSDNNRLTIGAFGRVRDVRAEGITVPTGNIDSGPPLVPRLSVRNVGNTTVGFPLVLRLEDGYLNSQNVSNLLAGELREVSSFVPWQPHRGIFAVACTAGLAGDIDPGNDWRNASVSVAVHDLRAVTVNAPRDTIPIGPVVPQATVRNLGTLREACKVFFRINSTPAYLDSLVLTAGLPYSDTLLQFQDWDALPGSFVARCSVGLAGDMVRNNDTAGRSFYVPAPPGTPVLYSPTRHDTLYTDRPAFVWSKVNPGQMCSRVSYDFEVAMDTLFSPPLQETTTYDTTHTVAPLGTGVFHWRVRALDSLGGPGSWSEKWDFTVCVHMHPLWEQMNPLPQGNRLKNVKDGGALTYSLETGPSDSGFVYAFKGNNRYEFYRYNTLSGAWVTRESIPAIGSTSRKKAVKKGSTLVVAGDGMVYGAKGNGTLEWWQFDPVANKWTEKASVLSGAKALKEGVGSAAVTIGSDDYVYLLRGSATWDFMRYKVGTDAWETRAPAPGGLSTKAYKNGSSICYDGSDTIYCLKGSTNEFAAYSITGDNWVTKDPLPMVAPPGTKKKKVKDGSGQAFAGGTVYALKGGGTNEFWAFNTTDDKWYVATELTAGPKTVKGGGALTYADNDRVLYAFRGNNTLEFWRYWADTQDSRPLFIDPDEGVQATPAPGTGRSSLSIAPNPLVNDATVSYSLPIPGRVSLKLYDVLGRLVRTLSCGHRPAGASSFGLRAADFPAGVYLLRLDSPDGRLTRRLVVE